MQKTGTSSSIRNSFIMRNMKMSLDPTRQLVFGLTSASSQVDSLKNLPPISLIRSSMILFPGGELTGSFADGAKRPSKIPIRKPTLRTS